MQTIRSLRGSLVIPAALGMSLVGLGAQTAPARYFNPRFSADGRSLILESTRDGKYAVYTIGVDGTGLRKLTDGRQDDAQPQWSADGRFVILTSNATGVHKVHIMAADGTGRRAVSTGPRHDAAPALSPDGTLVAWASTTELDVNWRDIGIARADGTAGRLITSGPGNDQGPVFISNTRLVFTREFPPKTNWRDLTPEDHATRRASSEIMAVNMDGNGLENLTNNDVLDSGPSWAEAVQRIYFTSSRGGSEELFSMTVTGSDVRRVMDAAGIQPSVSPDGRHVTYTRIVGNRSAVYVFDIATAREREVIGAPSGRPTRSAGPRPR